MGAEGLPEVPEGIQINKIENYLSEEKQNNFAGVLKGEVLRDEVLKGELLKSKTTAYPNTPWAPSGPERI